MHGMLVKSRPVGFCRRHGNGWARGAVWHWRGETLTLCLSWSLHLIASLCHSKLPVMVSDSDSSSLTVWCPFYLSSSLYFSSSILSSSSVSIVFVLLPFSCWLYLLDSLFHCCSSWFSTSQFLFSLSNYKSLCDVWYNFTVGWRVANHWLLTILIDITLFIIKIVIAAEHLCVKPLLSKQTRYQSVAARSYSHSLIMCRRKC